MKPRLRATIVAASIAAAAIATVSTATGAQALAPFTPGYLTQYVCTPAHTILVNGNPYSNRRSASSYWHGDKYNIAPATRVRQLKSTELEWNQYVC
jgi:hypothetical protein